MILPEAVNSVEKCEALLEKYGSRYAIATALGISRSGVHRAFAEFGMPTERRRVPDTIQEPQGDDLVTRLYQLLKKSDRMTVPEVADMLDCAPAKVRMALQELWGMGYALSLDEGDVALNRGPQLGRTCISFGDADTRYFKVALVADTHWGSKWEAHDAWADFTEFCSSEGVEAIYHAGDMVDGNGMFRGHVNELRGECITATAQAELAAKRIMESGLPFYFILGNHDLSFYRSAGFDIGRCIEDATKASMYPHEVRCLGHDQARIMLGGDACVLDMIHPDGGTAYALSYHAQKHVEGYDSGDKPHILSIGHYHKAVELPHLRSVAAFLPGSFCWQTPFMKRRRLSAHVAGCVVEGWIRESSTGERTLTRLRAEWLKYYRRPSGETVCSATAQTAEAD